MTPDRLLASAITLTLALLLAGFLTWMSVRGPQPVCSPAGHGCEWQA